MAIDATECRAWAQDVKAAWEHYLAYNNVGRGVVLIGHSQGSGLLTRLIASEIDGKPVQVGIVSWGGGGLVHSNEVESVSWTGSAG